MSREGSIVEQKRGIGLGCAKCGRPARVTRWGKSFCYDCHDELLAILKTGQTPVIIAPSDKITHVGQKQKHASDCICPDCNPTEFAKQSGATLCNGPWNVLITRTSLIWWMCMKCSRRFDSKRVH